MTDKNTSVGLQMYSVRSLMEDYENNNSTAIFKEIADMGYDYVEACSYAEGLFSGKSPRQFITDVESAGLKVLSSHSSIELTREELYSGIFTESMAKWDQSIKAHKEAGVDNVIMAWLQAPSTLSEWEVYCNYFNAVGRKCRDAGLRFGYHNHWFEFDLVDGMLPYQFILEHTNPELVFMELDTYWMISKGQNPVEWINRYPGRFLMMHIKDRTYVGGSGEIDFLPILQSRKKAGTEYTIVEVEWYGEMTVKDAVGKSYEYLKPVVECAVTL